MATDESFQTSECRYNVKSLFNVFANKNIGEMLSLFHNVYVYNVMQITLGSF